MKRLDTDGMKEPVDTCCALLFPSNVINLPLELSKALFLLGKCGTKNVLAFLRQSLCWLFRFAVHPVIERITVPISLYEYFRPVQVLGNPGSDYGPRRMILGDTESDSHNPGYPHTLFVVS